MSGGMWLKTAAEISGAGGARAENYGRPLINFIRIALRWSVHLGHYVSPVDVVWMMVELKAAREQNVFSPDNYVDAMGYLNCADDVNAQLKEMGFSNLDDLSLVGFSGLWELYLRLIQDEG